MHIALILLVVFIIVIIQWRHYDASKKNQKILASAFPEGVMDEKVTIDKDDDENVVGLRSQHDNLVWNKILTSINMYLANNRGSVSDFHLMKDIVDRNCDAKEEEINAQIPVPLYLGLVGTMFGILVGVGYLVIGGGLGQLLNPSASTGATGSSGDGIEALMGGVALAMISSIFGIILTTVGSINAKTAKATVEVNKNNFLSWMQAKLLPSLSNDTVQALGRLIGNLNRFNDQFALNASQLAATLSEVHSIAQDQVDILNAMQQFKIVEVVTANVTIYDHLRNFTNEIGALRQYLRDVNQYLTDMRQLNEAMHQTYRAENEEIEQRRENISLAVGRIDNALTEHLKQLGEHTSQQFEEFNKTLGREDESMGQALSTLNKNMEEGFSKVTDTMNQTLSTLMETTVTKFTEVTDAMEAAMKGKLTEIGEVVDELKQLTAVKSAMDKLDGSIGEQNRKIDKLCGEISSLAMAKTTGQPITLSPPEKTKAEQIQFWILTIAGVLIILALVLKPIKWLISIIF